MWRKRQLVGARLEVTQRKVITSQPMTIRQVAKVLREILVSASRSKKLEKIEERVDHIYEILAKKG
jgi:chromosomal replication initiation ATPase DnaA